MIKFDRVCRRHGLTVHTHYTSGAGMPCCACQSEWRHSGARTPIREDIVAERAAAAEERKRIRVRKRYLKDLARLEAYYKTEAGRATRARGYAKKSGRYHQDMDLLKEFMGGKCEHCGYEHDLEFHHTTPRRTGSGRKLSEIIKRKAYDEALEEIKGCEMLCSDCHDDADAELRSLENPEK